jgi:hypothetical protein
MRLTSNSAYLWLSWPFAATGAILSARYGIGYWMLFTYSCLPIYLVVLRRLLPFRSLLPEQDEVHLLAWRRPTLILIGASSIVALLTFWIHDLGWFDLADFPEPPIARQSILNVVILRPMASADNFVGRYILALYYLWSAWMSAHLCSTWRVDCGSPRLLVLRLVSLIWVSWAYFFGGMVILMMFANSTGAHEHSRWELVLAWSTATFIFSVGMFLAKYTNVMFATLLAAIR